MIRHLCLIRYKDPASVTPQMQQRIEQAYLSLPGLIPGILSMQVGRDRGLLEGNADLAIQATFEDEEAFRRYSVHPAHGEVIFPVLGAHMLDYSTAQF
ncbi:Dabb family protein [Flavisphingomonas formosensis]|uniref:Dabb family protein n=1 Tax=Flavisphingomonas formosensis TaxID=861534 RepID=UPI0012FA8FFE|nr:Dabb family protein [Sphingomonas formosensis]